MIKSGTIVRNHGNGYTITFGHQIFILDVNDYYIVAAMIAFQFSGTKMPTVFYFVCNIG